MMARNNKSISILPDKSALPREADRNGDSVFDRVWKYYYSPKKIALTKKEDEQRGRWEFAWKLLGDILITSELINLHCAEFDIDEQTAYRDLKNAKLLFGDSQDQMKKAKREIASMWAQKALKKTFDEGEWKAFEKILLRYSRLNGLDVDENDQLADMIAKMKPHTIIISGDPKILKQEADRLMADVKTEDIEYETIAGPEDE